MHYLPGWGRGYHPLPPTDGVIINRIRLVESHELNQYPHFQQLPLQAELARGPETPTVISIPANTLASNNLVPVENTVTQDLQSLVHTAHRYEA